MNNITCMCDCSGKYYYEATVTDEGLCRVGWATDKATLNLGTDKFGYGFGGTGKKSYNKQFDDYGEVSKCSDSFVLARTSALFLQEICSRKNFLREI